eukprot:1109044-Pyramimonas_sp.AAC.1
MGSDKFEIRSRRGDSPEQMTHCEGKIGRGTSEPAMLPLDDLRSMCDTEVPSADVYAAVHKGGLYLGPMFQVCKHMMRSD